MVKSKSKPNYQLLFVVFALLGYGLTVLYSASTVKSFSNFGNTTHYIIHQLLYGALTGLVLMVIFSKIDYHLWQKYLPFLIFLSLGLLVLVKIPGLSYTAGGASRWLHLGPVNFQPAELAKLVVILYMASWADKNRHKLNDFYYGLLPSLTIIGLFSLLILWQPDMGTMLVLLMVAFVMLFVSGVNIKYFAYSGFAGLAAIYLLIKFEPYRFKRLLTFLNPDLDPKGISYQINQALLAIGSGGLWGYGYGLSRQKHYYLPEVMNDSIFAVMSEELGFVRILAALILFAWLAVVGLKISRSAKDTFGRMVAFGISSWIIIQTVINLGAMVNLLPLTGIPLPFFSYGSTALIANLSAIGILFNIHQQSHA